MNNITKNRAPLEGNFVLSLYKNPSELYIDFPIDESKDLITSDGKFYYSLGKNMLRKGIKNFDEITVLTFLEDYPDLKSEYESKGGWKSIREYMNILDINNVEAYYNELMKNNLLIQLEKKGFDVENVTALNKLNTADDVVDYFDAVLNAAALSISHDIKLEKLSYTDKDIERKKKGEDIGLQFGSACPLLNSFCNGIPRKGMTMFASYTNGGKTSFVFENIVLPLISQKHKVCVISNEQDSMIFKDLLYLHVLTSDLNYWNITRTKLKSFDFNEEDTQMFKKADKILKEKYEPYVLFERIYDYSMKEVKRTIRKLAKQRFELFIYDTFKVDNTTDVIWQSFLNNSKDLFQIASKENVAIITPVQIALSTKGKTRWLNEAVLANSKQISEIYEEIFMFRDIWRDEFTGQPQDIHPFTFEKDEKGWTKVKKEIPLTFEDGKHYKIFFHTKSRNGEVGRTVLYEFKPYANKWRELGLCNVGEENRI